MYRPAAHDKGLALVGSCAEAPKQVVADRLRVKQIAANLLSNAIKYTSEGHVSLSFGLRGADRWVMQIADTGPGLEAGDAQHLFGGSATGTEVVPRRGIGLAITKDLVDLLGGSLQVITKAGGGTLFEIVLPIGPSAT
jgi:signal transduction histidine kinase